MSHVCPFPKQTCPHKRYLDSKTKEKTNQVNYSWMKQYCTFCESHISQKRKYWYMGKFRHRQRRVHTMIETNSNVKSNIAEGAACLSQLIDDLLTKQRQLTSYHCPHEGSQKGSKTAPLQQVWRSIITPKWSGSTPKCCGSLDQRQRFRPEHHLTT